MEQADEILSGFTPEKRKEVDRRIEDIRSNGTTIDYGVLGKVIEELSLPDNAIPATDTVTPSKVKDFNRTDLGNAEKLVAMGGDNFRFCKELNSWLIWNGIHWAFDQDFQMERIAVETIRGMMSEAIEMGGDQQSALLTHSLKAETPARIKAMIELAKIQEGVPVRPDELDVDPGLINCLNGTLDIVSGELRGHRKDDLITKVVPVKYDPEATCPTWDSFLDRIMEGNENLISYLQRLVGYCLSGLTKEQCMWIFHGTGANGKSTFIETIRALLADYAVQTDPSTLKLKKDEGIGNGVARVSGRRFLTAVETGLGDYLDEVLIKRLTGDDTITARYMYKEFFEFRNTAKVVIASNHIPKIKGRDHAIWRRVKIVPFEVTIQDSEMDRNLPEKLTAELPGILAWAVRGCLDWQKSGLQHPPEVVDATAAFKSEMESIPAFIKERCVTGYKYRIRKSILWDAYQEWCFGKKIKPHRRGVFNAEVQRQGFHVVKSEVEYYTGLELTPAGIGERPPEKPTVSRQLDVPEDY